MVTKLLIKNMVSIRCKMIVAAELESLGIATTVIELGEVELKGKLTIKDKVFNVKLSKEIVIPAHNNHHFQVQFKMISTIIKSGYENHL